MGFVCNIYVENSLVHFYSVCKSFGDASRVFDEMLVRDVVSWTSVISGYVRAGLFDEVVGWFLRMDVEPNAVTFVSVLVNCGRKGYLSVGKGIHGLSFKSAFGVGLEVSNALMDMYVKCGCLPGAKQVFDVLVERDFVSWTSVGCAGLGSFEQYKTGTERRNASKPERSVPNKKLERRPEQILQLCLQLLKTSEKAVTSEEGCIEREKPFENCMPFIKMDFPRFNDGDDPIEWVYKPEQ